LDSNRGFKNGDIIMRKSLILFLGIGLLVGGCDLLNNQKPQQSLPFNDAYQTISVLNQDLTGAYNDLQDQNGEPVGGADWSVYGEIMADNTNFQGSYPTLQDMSQHKMDPNNGSANEVWYGSYKVINDVNIILDKLNSIQGADQAEVDNLKGQSLFLRGMVYYYLVNFYAKPWVGGPGATNSQLGVPLLTKPVTSAADFTFPKRASVSAVYTQIKKDLSDAASILKPATADGQGNKYAAMAILARVAMQQHDYATAETITNQIMSSGTYALNSDVQTFFTNEFSPESIFEISNTVQDNVGVNTSLTALYNPKERNDIRISTSYVQALDKIVPQAQQDNMAADSVTYTDTRISELLTGTTGSSSSVLKYEDYLNNSDNAPIFRYAEVLLDRAEALARTGGVNQESVDLLNQIRERAIKVSDKNGNPVDNSKYIDYQMSDFGNAQDLIDTILLERRVELAFEGQRFFDLTRTGQNIVGQTGKSESFDAGDLRFPIPQTEMDANKNLEQNPAYK